MKNFSKILVAIGGSEISMKAAVYAIEISIFYEHSGYFWFFKV
jgi:hypothetical protein